MKDESKTGKDPKVDLERPGPPSTRGQVCHRHEARSAIDTRPGLPSTRGQICHPHEARSAIEPPLPRNAQNLKTR
jgi:hypothetical protein